MPYERGRGRLVNPPERIFDHSTLHGRIHSFLYRLPWNLILPMSALAFIIFVSVVSIQAGLRNAELYKRQQELITTTTTTTTTITPIILENIISPTFSTPSIINGTTNS